MPLFKKISENRFELDEIDTNSNRSKTLKDLKQLMAKIKQKYPLVKLTIDGDIDGNIILDVETGETNFYISRKPNGKFSVTSVWPADEKGKKNLDADKMVQSIGNIRGGITGVAETK
jgi:hypothetical protein